MELVIRDARPEDVGFIARTVLEGVGYAAFDPSAAGLPVELSAGTIPLPPPWMSSRASAAGRIPCIHTGGHV